MPTASDIMSREPYMVSPESSVKDLARILTEKNFSGAPVVDPEGQLVGVVTSSDLIYQKKKLHLPTVFTLLDSVIPLSGLHDVDDQMNKILGQTVKDIMTAEVLTVEEDTPLEEIATIMTEQHKHLLPVISQGKVVGVVDRWDVLRAIVKE